MLPILAEYVRECAHHVRRAALLVLVLASLAVTFSPRDVSPNVSAGPVASAPAPLRPAEDRRPIYSDEQTADRIAGRVADCVAYGFTPADCAREAVTDELRHRSGHGDY